MQKHRALQRMWTWSARQRQRGRGESKQKNIIRGCGYVRVQRSGPHAKQDTVTALTWLGIGVFRTVTQTDSECKNNKSMEDAQWDALQAAFLAEV